MNAVEAKRLAKSIEALRPAERAIYDAIGVALAFAAFDDAAALLRAQAVQSKLLTDGARLAAPEDLFGAKESALFLGIDKTTLARWKRDNYAPPPFAELATGPVWLRADLDAFSEAHRLSADRAGRRPRAS